VLLSPSYAATFTVPKCCSPSSVYSSSTPPTVSVSFCTRRTSVHITGLLLNHIMIATLDWPATHSCCTKRYSRLIVPSLCSTIICEVATMVQGSISLPSNRHHWSNSDCLEGKRKNYQVCSVQYCVQELCTVQRTHIRTDLTVLWIGFCLNGPISLCLDSFLYMYYCMHV